MDTLVSTKIKENDYYSVLEKLIKKRKDSAKIYSDTKEYKSGEVMGVVGYGVVGLSLLNG